MSALSSIAEADRKKAEMARVEDLTYVAISPRTDWVEDWCRRYGVNFRSRQVKAATIMRDVRGIDRCHIILINGWQDGKSEAERIFDYLTAVSDRAANIYVALIDIPIVDDEGRIVGWRKEQ